MNQEQKGTSIQEKRLCKNCGKKLPSKSDFCMYCGHNNSDHSLTTSKMKKNDSVLKRYNSIEVQKFKPIWYGVFLFLVIDILVMSVLFLFNSSSLYVEKFPYDLNKYEKTFYVGEETFIVLKDKHLEAIGKYKNQLAEAMDKINEYEVDDIKQINELYFSYLSIQTHGGKNFTLQGAKLIAEEKRNTEYKEVYEFLNIKKGICKDVEHRTLIEENKYYYDEKDNAVYYILKLNYSNSCYSPKVTKVLSSKKIGDNASLIYQDNEGKLIYLKLPDKILKIEKGTITEEITTIKANKDIEVANVKNIFYKDKNFLVIDNKNILYKTNETDKSNISISSEFGDIKLSKESKTTIFVLLAIILLNIVIMYKESDNGYMRKCFSISAVLLVEIIIYVVYEYIKNKLGFPIKSSDDFFTLLKLLAILYCGILVVSNIFVQISEITNSILKVISFKNIYTFILVLFTILTIFLNVLTSGTYGLIFAIFTLGIVWSIFTEGADIDLNLFVNSKSQIVIIVLAAVNIITFIVLINIFNICNYFLTIIILSLSYGIYLAARPKLEQKEIINKNIKSLITVFMYVAFTLISTLLTIGLYQKLLTDDGTIMKYVLSLGLSHLMNIVLIIVAVSLLGAILQVIHAIIKQINKNTNSIIVMLIFTFIITVITSTTINFFPNILNTLDYCKEEIDKVIFK